MFKNMELEQPKKFKLKTKIEDMMAYGLQAVRNFPREDRQAAAEIRRTMLTMYRLSITVEKKFTKKTTIQELDIELAVLRHLVRMMWDARFHGPAKHPPLSPKQYEVWARYLDEVGNLVGGYIKSLGDKPKI